MGSDGPTDSGGSASESWWGAYINELAVEYQRRLPRDSPQPQAHKLEVSSDSFLGPLDPLLQLSEASRARYTEKLLAKPLPQFFLQHSTQTRYPKMPIEHPVIWMSKRYGRFETKQGIVKVLNCVAPALVAYTDFFPVATCSEEVARQLGLSGELAQIRKEQWEEEAFRIAASLENEAALGRLYCAAAPVPPAPQVFRARVGHRV